MIRPILPNRDARRLFLHCHALAETPSGPGKGTDLANLIQQLGFVQLDSINTVARAHDLILFSRRPAYRQKHLKTLYENDRGLFEHWTHDAAVIPMTFYPHWQLRFQRDADALKARWKNWRRDGFEAKFAEVLAHIRDHGPACSSDVGQDEKRGSGGWWDWHPSKTALEYLWRSGALCVTGRNGFQKRYDLTERVIDTAYCDPASHPDPSETVDWLCNAALDRLGFATSGELAAFWATATAAETKDWCAKGLAAGDLIEVDVQGSDGVLRRSFARPNVTDLINAAPKPCNRLRILSPFDPALRDRNRAERLFGFHYRIEVFTPAPKRRYGYYVFPILQGDRIIGRVDMKAHRADGVLNVTAVWPEPSVKWSPTRQKALEAELARITRLAEVARVEFTDNWLRQDN